MTLSGNKTEKIPREEDSHAQVLKRSLSISSCKHRASLTRNIPGEQIESTDNIPIIAVAQIRLAVVTVYELVECGLVQQIALAFLQQLQQKRKKRRRCKTDTPASLQNNVNDELGC